MDKPIAWLEPEWGEKICPEVGYEVTMTEAHPRDLGWIPLAAQRTWVGLTDDEVMEMMEYDKQYGHIPQYARNFVEAISAKLKEKNNG